MLVAGLTSGLLCGLGLPAGWMPPAALWSIPAAIAQATVTNEEVTQYARAVLQMDAYRSEAYTQIKDLLLGVNVDISAVDMSCTNTRDLSDVPRRVRRDVEKIVVDYCNQARAIVEDNGLNARRFNEITAAHRDDAALAERIRREMLRLQES